MSENVFFKPWVGCNYASGRIFDRKILSLGESHYCGCGEQCKFCSKRSGGQCSGFTSQVVRDYLNQDNEREGWMNTYLKFERSLVNRETTPEESVQIWNSILFYNFLQEAMQVPRQAGTPEQYQSAAEPFFSVIDQYQPDLLIVWGIRLWNALPSERWIDGEPISVDGYENPNGYYQLSDGKKLRVVCVYHPSAAYSWDYWYKVIEKVK